jgi:hypothetical protein
MAILEEHYSATYTSEGIAETHSLSPLFYFLNYLETANDLFALRKVSFWSACEKYRRLRNHLLNVEAVTESYSPYSSVEDLDHIHQLIAEAKAIFLDFFGSDAEFANTKPDLVSSLKTHMENGTSCSATDQKLSESLLNAQDTFRSDLDGHFANFVHSEHYFLLSSEIQKAKLTDKLPDLNAGKTSSNMLPNISGRIFINRDEAFSNGAAGNSGFEEIELKRSALVWACQQELQNLGTCYFLNLPHLIRINFMHVNSWETACQASKLEGLLLGKIQRL